MPVDSLEVNFENSKWLRLSLIFSFIILLSYYIISHKRISIHLKCQTDHKPMFHLQSNISFGISLLTKFLDSDDVKYFDGFSPSSIQLTFELIHWPFNFCFLMPSSSFCLLTKSGNTSSDKFCSKWIFLFQAFSFT